MVGNGPETLCPGDQADGWSHYNGVDVVDSGTDIQWECLGISIFDLIIRVLGIVADKFVL